DGRTFEYAEDGGKPITRKILERQQDNFSQKRSIPRVRGRLQQFLGEWQTITSDPDILGIVKEGYRIPFKTHPSMPISRPLPHTLSAEATASMDKE
ncbi:hypothetical protein BGX23_002986, partial [Mortierella sp. AD031]